ncbi:DUF5906 domain-containing protein [Lacinutrix sp. Hel_I_90]|uniref:DUF5906 domain-containing protein n=1 Tax=Lacinutrix sp. Hel_I_90 TaxID=1249999 RepID=UPI0005CB7DEC|nr:DUF5906 domain-containing protein [Lacinutrix sp. Hel_I_90]
MSQQLSDKIYQASNKGLDIITSVHPDALNIGSNSKKTFRAKNDTTKHGSSTIKLIKGIYWMADWVESNKAKTGIQVYMDDRQCDYITALKELAVKFGVTTNPKDLPSAILEFKEAKPTEKVGCTFDYNNKINDFELKTLGPEVTEKLCDEFNIKSCKSFTRITESGKKVISTATADYPIFVFDFGSWQKIYQPLNQDKRYRFSYNGIKPANFIFGFELLPDKQVQHAFNVEAEWDYEKKTKGPKKQDLKLDNIIIASGDRDALNIASFGYNVIWLNSESDRLTRSDYIELKKLASNIYILPDIDGPGIEAALKFGIEYDDIKIIWLPKWLRNQKDFRGNGLKDFRDYVLKTYYSGSEYIFKKNLEKLVENAMPLRFWNETWIPKKEALKYDYNNTYAMHFIEHQGYFVYESDQSKEDYEFVKVTGNIVQKVKGHHIKKHLFNHLETTNKPVNLRNMLLRTNQLSDKSLSQLNRIEPSFEKANFSTQYLFFNHQTWEVTTKGIKAKKLGSVKNYVWKSDIIQHEPKIQEQPFTITKLDDGSYDIEIHTTTNKYLNYLINTSRVYWREDLEVPYITETGFNKVEKEKYFKENQFNIAGKNLSPSQIHEQKQHLVNKIFTVGYLLHSYKSKSKGWAVWNMDYKVVDDLESNGGTGKSLFFNLLFPILKNVKQIEGRQKGLADKDFLFDGVTDKTDLVFIDDADAYFRFNRLFTAITGDLQVNPKGTSAYEIKFDKSPKIAISSNFGLQDVDGSTRRRLLFVLTGDYYHDKSDDYNEGRQVSDDFGGKQLLSDFTPTDWEDYYNATAYCTSFYLGCEGKLNPPMDNVEKRNLVREMKSPFKNWADLYFTIEDKTLNAELERKQLYSLFKDSANQPNYSPNRFKKSLESWCKFYGYKLNPENYARVKDGRIIDRFNGKPTEFFIIQTEPEADLIKVEKPQLTIIPEAEKEEDIPF